MARGGMMDPNIHFGSAMDEFDDTIKVEETLGACSLRDSDDRYVASDIFKKPGRLIYTDDKGLLAMNVKVLSQLSKIHSKISVVGVCGLYRSGKSYLMNWLAEEKSGFALGDTIQSETRGIWIWCKVHPKRHDQVLLLVDTEGLDDPEKGDPDHDTKLFCLTLLICSTLIINVKGVLNYSAFKKLAFIAKLSDSIKIVSQKDDEESNSKNFPIAAPRLVMCIRDFYLKTEKNGKTLTPNEYLDDCLQPSSKQGRNTEKFNIIKKSIVKFFPKRNCITMAQPTINEKLQDIESLSEDSLSEQFVKDATTLKMYIYDRKPKVICNASKKPIDGADLASLVTTYVEALRKGYPIQCVDAYSQASKQRNDRALREVMKEFKLQLDKGRSLTSKRKLHDMFIRLFDKQMAKYRDESFVYKQDYYEDKLMEEMQTYNRMIQDKIQKKCQTEGTTKLSALYDDMLRKNGSAYKTCVSYAQYESDMQTLEEEFMSQMKDYDKDDIQSCLNDFKKSKNDDKMKLFQAATEKLDKEKYSKHFDDIENMLQARMDNVIHSELTKRNQYLEDELKKLKRSYNDIDKKLKSKRMCMIM